MRNAPIWQTLMESALWWTSTLRIDGDIKARRYQIMRLEIELAHVDHVIKMFQPSYDLSKIATKRSFVKNPAGTPIGSGSREALTVLREAGEPHWRCTCVRHGMGSEGQGTAKGELKRRNVSYGQLVAKLAEIGVVDSEPNIRNKLSRGKFTAVFLIQCLEAIGSSSLRLAD